MARFNDLEGAKTYALEQAEENSVEETENPDIEEPIMSGDSPSSGTIGEYMMARQTTITTITGGLGAGLMVLASIKRNEE